MRRNRQVLFRLTDEEYEKLLKDVKRSGLNREEFIRSALDHTVFKEMPQLEFTEILRHLREINHNMNQIAMKAHTTGMIDAKQYRECNAALQEQIGVIICGLY